MKRYEEEKFIPKVGDLCWFQWSQPKTANYQIISTLKAISDNGFYYEDINSMVFEFCEPFIGNLPSFLKQGK